MSTLLLRPLLYLRVTHASSTLPWMNWGMPAVIAAAIVLATALAAPGINAFHQTGVFDRLLGFVQSLPGFYLAALAAVATFNRPSLDQPMPGTAPRAHVLYNGKPTSVELTRRRFLSLIFSYLTALSFALTLGLVFGLPLADIVRDALPAGFYQPARALIAGVIVLFTAQMLTITLWGLYYLGERIHTPD